MSSNNFAIILAGGVGVRASTNGIPKQFLKVKEIPIIIRTIQKFEECDDISEIVIVCLQEYKKHVRNLVEYYRIKKIVAIVDGGTTGQESIYNGLKAVGQLEIDEDSIVVVHDAVRPMISSELISECIHSARVFGNGIASVVCHETVAKASCGRVNEILKREELVKLKAPQAFLYKSLWNFHLDARARGVNDFIDSASMVSSYGQSLYLVSSNTSNIKVTYPEDVFVLKALLDIEESKDIIGV